MKIIVKASIFFCVIGLWNFITSIINPLVIQFQNNLALKQMDTTMESTIWLEIFKALQESKYLLLIFFLVLLFTEDVYDLYQKKCEEHKED